MLRQVLLKLCVMRGMNYDDAVKQLNTDPEKKAELADELCYAPELTEQRKKQLAKLFNMSIQKINAVEDTVRATAANGSKEYSVCFLFNENLTHVLLQRKLRTEFAGLLNGIGGTQRDDENMFEGALREIQEETGVKPEDIINFGHLGTLTLNYDCKTKTNTPCVLHYFTGVVNQEKPSPQPGEPELLEWHNVNYVQNTPVSLAEKQFAGNGDLQYFVHMAVKYHQEMQSMNMAHTLKRDGE